jgi:hypothetical protein
VKTARKWQRKGKGGIERTEKLMNAANGSSLQKYSYCAGLSEAGVVMSS